MLIFPNDSSRQKAYSVVVNTILIPLPILAVVNRWYMGSANAVEEIQYSTHLKKHALAENSTQYQKVMMLGSTTSAS